ncbi:response regulator, partial [Candidatus Bathyarchaeota archaeon]|nr:response regulator [Candidatus Bathyarchaeota archaeon]
MKEAVRILIIEDSEDDASLLVEQIKQAGIRIEFKIISSKEGFLECLAQEEWDIILSDEKMPGFSGSEALKILKESGLDIPFVLVSGIIPADIGADVMYQGAKDFIKKDDISRLIPIIQRELDQKQIRDEREILLEKGDNFLFDSKIILAYMKGGKISKRVETIMLL